MDGMPKPPPDYANQGPALFACGLVLIIVPTVAVAIRIWSRIIAIGHGLWWDDYLVLALMIVSHAYLAVNIWWTTIGLGKHSWMTPSSEIVPNDIANRVALTLYSVAITLVKVSALMLYARLFQVNKPFRITLWALGGIATAWGIVLILVPWMFCHPLSKNVDPLGPGTCMSNTPWYLGSAFINAILDLTILFLPTPIIWRLQLKLKRKILISIVLLFGYCSAFLSLARFIIIVRNPGLLAVATDFDPSWNLMPIVYLSILEAPFALVALCGPPIHQFVQRYTKLGFRSLFSTGRYATPLNDHPLGQPRSHSNDLYNDSKANSSSLQESLVRSGLYERPPAVNMVSSHRDIEDENSKDFPLGSIAVKRDFSMDVV